MIRGWSHVTRLSSIVVAVQSGLDNSVFRIPDSAVPTADGTDDRENLESRISNFESTRDD